MVDLPRARRIHRFLLWRRYGFLFCLICLGGISAPVVAGTLGDFKKNAEKEQQQNKERRESLNPPQAVQQPPAFIPPQPVYNPPQYQSSPGYYSYPPQYYNTAPPPPQPRPSTEPAAENKCDTLCRGFSALFGAIGEVWFDHHTSTYYDQYPYGGASESWLTLRKPEKVTHTVEVKRLATPEDNGAFKEELYEDGKETIMYLNRKGKYEFKEIPRYRVRHVPAKKGVKRDGEIVTEKREVTELVPPAGKRNFINVEGLGVYTDAETYAFGGGFQTRFAGIIGLIGEYRQFRDQTDRLIFAGFGAELAFVQSGSLSWSFYGQLNGFSGVLYLSGAGYGTRLQWFPGGRIGVDFRLGKIEVPDLSFWDFNFRLGVFIGRAQVFAGYRIIESNLAHLKGYETGIQLWF